MMKLPVLLKDLISLPPIDIDITGLALDSRKVCRGNLFFACVGTHLDGRNFIEEAIRKGAQVVLAEGDEGTDSVSDVPIYFIPNLSKKIGEIAARFYGYPSQKMSVVGVTGTNGKTSTTHFIAEILSRLQFPCGLIGTLGNGLYGKMQESNLTTPDAITLQQTLAGFLEYSAKYTAMEVSSHSIDQGRMNGIEFELGIFTNLSRDHLDYHGTMENYGATKKKLFESPHTKKIIINADDEFGLKMLKEFHSQKPTFAYSLGKSALPSGIPCIYAKNIRQDINGIQASVVTPWGEGVLNAKLIGQFNLSNLLAALTALCLLDIPFETVLKTLSQVSSVPGRMQALIEKGRPLVVIDYAHTPDALLKVLQALRHHTSGKLICIFGCGGDRDRGKRPMMAEIAEKFSDVVMITDDNPRTENADNIFTDILKGFSHPENILKEHDRTKAIQYFLQQAKEEDCILIAGKGAEPYQIIGEQKIKFSDAAVVMDFYRGKFV